MKFNLSPTGTKYLETDFAVLLCSTTCMQGLPEFPLTGTNLIIYWTAQSSFGGNLILESICLASNCGFGG